MLEALTTLSRLVLNRVSEKSNRREVAVEESVPSDSEEIFKLSSDASWDEVRSSSGIPAAQTRAGALPPISLACHAASVEGAMLRIPLDIYCGGLNRKLIVTVSIDPE